AIQRVTGHVTPVTGTNLFRRLAVEIRLTKNTHAICHPHPRSVNILVSVIVEIQPAGAHAGADVIDTRFRRDGRKGSIAIVSVQIVAAEVIHDVQIRPAITVVVVPAAGKTVTIIFDVQPGSLSTVTKAAIAFVVEEEVWRTVARVKIRNGITILVESYVIRVQAEVDVQAAVAVIIRNGGAGECSGGRVLELEGVGPVRKFSI